jgi:hypothetical protein
MSAAAVAVPSSPQRRIAIDLGRPFVHPAFDLLVIGGGLSLLFAVALRLASPLALPAAALWTLVLLVNSAHFAASTVRLYTKEGAFRDLPFVTMGLPAAALAVLLAALVFPAALGRHLVALYFTWSPYHYAAQAYGLAVMYAYRSGSTPSAAEKRWLRAACIVPFAYAFVAGKGAGIEWLFPSSALPGGGWARGRDLGLDVLGVVAFAAPLALFARGLLSRAAARLPVISALAMVANATWWVALTYWDAFIWATIFHGLQYLAIVLVFHVRERQRRDAAPRPWWRHALAFYGASLGLGYLLFQVWPHAGPLVGFAYAQTLLLVVATINIHHFIVDAFIWRLRKDPNYKVVAATPAAA